MSGLRWKAEIDTAATYLTIREREPSVMDGTSGIIMHPNPPGLGCFFRPIPGGLGSAKSSKTAAFYRLGRPVPAAPSSGRGGLGEEKIQKVSKAFDDSTSSVIISSARPENVGFRGGQTVDHDEIMIGFLVPESC
jgi:hypothetical protein